MESIRKTENSFSPIWGRWAAAGARSCREDGVSATVCINDGDTHNSPREQLETKYPLLIERYALIQDSGGAGRHRGGLGCETIIRALTDVTMNASIDRAHCLPWGLHGGLEGDRQSGAAAARWRMGERTA